VTVGWENVSMNALVEWLDSIKINYYIDHEILRSYTIMTGIGNQMSLPVMTASVRDVPAYEVMALIARATRGQWVREGSIYCLVPVTEAPRPTPVRSDHSILKPTPSKPAPAKPKSAKAAPKKP
jgi:hypothetical protein